MLGNLFNFPGKSTLQLLSARGTRWSKSGGGGVGWGSDRRLVFINGELWGGVFVVFFFKKGSNKWSRGPPSKTSMVEVEEILDDFVVFFFKILIEAGVLSRSTCSRIIYEENNLLGSESFFGRVPNWSDLQFFEIRVFFSNKWSRGPPKNFNGRSWWRSALNLLDVFF